MAENLGVEGVYKREAVSRICIFRELFQNHVQVLCNEEPIYERALQKIS